MEITIPSFPDPPLLDEHQIQALTRIVFLEPEEPTPCDAIFVFGGLHGDRWAKTAQAYRNGLGDQIIVTGGVNPKRTVTPGEPLVSEASVIAHELEMLGVPPGRIICEDRSSNSLENVTCAKEIFDFSAISSLLYVCKSYAAGRQYRTLKQQLPSHIHLVRCSFDGGVSDIASVSRGNWSNAERSRSLVFGEYLKILYYASKGDIAPVDSPVQGLERLVESYLAAARSTEI